MKTHVARWGNSLAIRIPRSCAEEAELERDTPVEVTVEQGKLVVAPIKRRATLAEMLEQITEDSLHGEVDWGSPVGKEVW